MAIVLCGKQTIDGDTAQVGPGIATRLGYAQLTLVDRIEAIDPVGRKIKVRRKLEGRHEIVEAALPVMITVVRELNRPRYPTVPMRLDSRDAVVKVWDNKELRLDERSVGLKGSPTWVSRIFSPEREMGEIVGDGLNDPLATADLLIDKLISKELLATRRRRRSWGKSAAQRAEGPPGVPAPPRTHPRRPSGSGGNPPLSPPA